MAEWLRALAALPKDTDCSPKGSMLGGLQLFLCSLWAWACMHVRAHRQTDRTHTTKSQSYSLYLDIQ